MKILDHYLQETRIVESNNCDTRPEQTTIDLIVIHCISLPPGKFGGHYIDQLFSNNLDPNDHPYFKSICQLKVSAHVLITRSGQITQFVPFNLRAWHAGPSSFQGRQRCNDYSIGIELEGTEHEPYNNEQYFQLAHLIRALINQYPSLSEQRIVGHSTIAPGRKTDPGESFDWEKLRTLLSDHSIQHDQFNEIQDDSTQ